MKLTFTFIIACFVVCSVMGQTEKIRSHQFGNIHQYNGNNRDLENLEGIRAERNSLKEFPFNQLNEPMLKSAQVSTQLLDSIVSEDVDAATGNMVLARKSLYTYNYIGIETLYISYIWDKSSNKWVGSYKDEYTYDFNGNKTMDIFYSWDTTNNKWLGSIKDEYTYDSNGKMTKDIGYYWNINTNNWIGNSKNETTYDSNGNIILDIGYIWETNNSKWVGSSKYESTYDSYGNENIFLIFSWDTSNSSWVNSSKFESTYDTNGNETLYYYYQWDKGNNIWFNYSKVEYAYDSNNNMTLYSSYSWDTKNNKWAGNSKHEYIYNNTKDCLLSRKDYTRNIYSDNWEISGNGIFYYSLHDVTGTINISTADINIFPNPVTNGFRISGLAELETIILSDLNGKVLISKEVANDEFVSTEALPQGIYLVRINTGNGSRVKKLVKK